MAIKPRVLVPLGPGFEELEAVAVIDILRRAGAHVVTASVGAKNPIVGRNRLRIMADLDIDEALTEWGHDWDLVVLPGGLGGVDAIEAHPGLMGLLSQRLDAGALTAAICAAPRALAKAGLGTATQLTGHPGCRQDLQAFAGYQEQPVVQDGAIVTSRGPGTAVAFGLTLCERLFGATRAAAIRAELVA